MEVVLYLPFSPSQKVFLIHRPFDRIHPYPLSSDNISAEILCDTRFHTEENMPTVINKLKNGYHDIKPVKITLKFDEEVYF